MSGLFTIPLIGIKDGHHLIEFEINKEFFDLFEDSEIKEGDLIAVTEIEKSASHIQLDINISGKVRVCCDRCLEMFDYTVDCMNRLLVKFGHEKDDSDPEIVTVPREEQVLDIKQYLYEFIHLTLPIQRIHPDDENGKSKCNPEMLQKLKEHLTEQEAPYDSRWDELKKLMDGN